MHTINYMNIYRNEGYTTNLMYYYTRYITKKKKNK